MPTVARPQEIGELSTWLTNNELPIAREFIQLHVRGKSEEVANAWLDAWLDKDCEAELEVWMKKNHPGELEIYNILRYPE